MVHPWCFVSCSLLIQATARGQTPPIKNLNKKGSPLMSFDVIYSDSAVAREMHHPYTVVILSCNSTTAPWNDARTRTRKILLNCPTMDMVQVPTALTKSSAEIYFLQNKTVAKEDMGVALKNGIDPSFIPQRPYEDNIVPTRLEKSIKDHVDGSHTRRSNGLGGAMLRIGVKYNCPWMIYHVTEKIGMNYSHGRNKLMRRNEVFNATGVDKDLISVLSKELNFTYRLFETSDEHFGSPLGNGYFTGLIGDLQDDFIDMAVSAISRNHERQQVAAFSYPYVTDFNQFVTQAPKRGSNSNALLIFGPYSYSIWCLIFASTLITGGVHYFLETFHEDPSTSTSRQPCFSTSLLLMVQILACVSAPHLRRTNASQCLLMVWIPAALILSAAYGGSIVAFLTADGKFNKPLNSINDLTNAIEAGQYHVLYRPGTSTGSVIQKADSGPYRTIREGFWNGAPPSSSIEVNLKYVLENERLAFIATMSSMKHVAASLGITRLLHFSREHFPPSYKAIAFQKTFQHAQLFDHKIIQVATHGILNAWIRASERKNQIREKPATNADETRRITITKLQGAFYILIHGLGSSCFCFICELMWWAPEIRQAHH